MTARSAEAGMPRVGARTSRLSPETAPQSTADFTMAERRAFPVARRMSAPAAALARSGRLPHQAQHDPKHERPEPLSP